MSIADGENLATLVPLPRAELATALARRFPDAVEPGVDARAISGLPRGGRAAALGALAAIDPIAYAKTRNHVAGAATGLSPWIRHGILSLAEVRDAALDRVERPEQAEKLVSELAWRAYWRLVHAALGDRIRSDIEPPAAVPRRPDRAASVPDDVRAAATGLRCIDDFVTRLRSTGRLHNHERMWLASWLVHARGVHWLAGADWFLRHLLDGDPASNHLSWQWVAGTFSAKPYLFTRAVLAGCTDDVHCGPCPLLGRCDVEGTHDEVAHRFFMPGAVVERTAARIRPGVPWRPAAVAATPRRPLVWLTLDSVAATSPARAAHPDSPALFVIDTAWLAAERPALGRLVFLFECLADVPGVVVAVGDPLEVVTAWALSLGCDGVAVADTPCPRVRAAGVAIAQRLPMTVAAWPPLCDASRAEDLGRFSRFWNRVRGTALRRTPPG